MNVSEDKPVKKNLDVETVNSFSDEWSRFDQTTLSEEEARRIFDEYFAIFPWGRLPENASGFDMGCGTGRWAKLVAPNVGHLHCIDPSEKAINVAKKNLSSISIPALVLSGKIMGKRIRQVQLGRMMLNPIIIMVK